MAENEVKGVSPLEGEGIRVQGMEDLTSVCASQPPPPPPADNGSPIVVQNGPQDGQGLDLRKKQQ